MLLRSPRRHSSRACARSVQPAYRIARASVRSAAPGKSGPLPHPAPEQYAYRQSRNAQRAVTEVDETLFYDHPDVVDADLADYFGSVPHTELRTIGVRRGTLSRRGSALQPIFNDSLSALRSILKTRTTGSGTVRAPSGGGRRPRCRTKFGQIHKHWETPQMSLMYCKQNAATHRVHGALKPIRALFAVALLCLGASTALSQNNQGQNDNNQGQNYQGGHLMSAPEIDPVQALGALSLLTGAVAIIGGYRRSKK